MGHTAGQCKGKLSARCAGEHDYGKVGEIVLLKEGALFKGKQERCKKKQKTKPARCLMLTQLEVRENDLDRPSAVHVINSGLPCTIYHVDSTGSGQLTFFTNKKISRLLHQIHT